LIIIKKQIPLPVWQWVDKFCLRAYNKMNLSPAAGRARRSARAVAGYETNGARSDAPYHQMHFVRRSKSKPNRLPAKQQSVQQKVQI
jgi:hypothetical protein